MMLPHIKAKICRCLLLVLVSLAFQSCRDPEVEYWEKSRDVPSMIDALHSNDEWTQAAAVMTLAKVGDQRAIVPLLELMPRASVSVRVKIPYALDNIDPRWPHTEVVQRHVPKLLNDLNAPDSRRRAVAVMVLGRMEDRNLSERLVPSLTDVSLSVRQAAVEALANSSTTDSQRIKQFVSTQPDSGAGMNLAVSVIALNQSSIGAIVFGFPRTVGDFIQRFSRGSWLMVGLLALAALLLVSSKLRYWQGVGLGMSAICSGLLAMVFYIVAVKMPFARSIATVGNMFAVVGITWLWWLPAIALLVLVAKSTEAAFGEDLHRALRVQYTVTAWLVRLGFVVSGAILIYLLLYGALVSRAAVIFVLLPGVPALIMLMLTMLFEWKRSWA